MTRVEAFREILSAAVESALEAPAVDATIGEYIKLLQFEEQLDEPDRPRDAHWLDPEQDFFRRRGGSQVQDDRKPDIILGQ